MSNIDSSAGSPGGPVTVPALDDLPDKMRVHALARLLSRTSKEVLGALAGLGIEVRGAQSSIDRKMAEQVVTALLPGAGPGASIAETQLPIPDTQPVSPRRTAAADPAFSAASVPPATTPPAATPDVGAPPVGALTPLFAAPAPLFQAPARPAAGRTGRRAPDPDPDDGAVEVGPTAVSTPRDTGSGDAEDLEDDAGEDAGASGIDDSDDEDGAARRRRRRGRRGRGRGRGGDELEDDAADTAGTDTAGTESDGTESDGAQSDGAESGGIVGVGTDESASADSDPGTDSAETDDAESDADSEFDGGDGDAGGSRRRRRRRRRRGTGDEAADGAAETGEDDPPATITRVRRPREPRAERDADGGGDGDGVQGVRGSTRLEAKRQRRRDGRDAGRRRVPILSEAEFLARRESVDRAMVVRERGGRVEIAVLEDDVLVEHFVAGAGSQSAGGQSMVGNIYLGRVQNVLPSMEAAFVDIGRGRNAVLYAGEVDWDAAGLGGKARRIEQALSSGDPVLVQVTKDPIGHKGARLTTQISLAGRFLVYVPSGGAAGISRKLPDVERKRLKDMLKEIVPSEAGVIIRTASEGVSHEALERDVRRLQAQWDVVRTRSEQTGPNKPKAPVLLYEEPDLLIKVVRDQFNEDFSRLVVQGDDGFDTLANYVGHVAPELADRLHRHTGAADVFTEFRIDEQLLKALDRKVWLPSGGTLVIDRTEAMTVVDVNTGKYTGSGGNLEETVTRNNLEAAEEIVRQLRLRDIGGIIVIDFIDMVLEGNRDLVLRRLTECLSRDRTRHQVAEVTSLGLVQMTRKRVGGGLLEHFSTPCEHCRGRGVIISAEPITEPGDEGRGSGGAEGAGRRSRGGRGARRGEGDGERGGQDGRGDGPGGGGRQNGSGHAAAMAPVIESPVIESPVIGRPAGGSPVGGSAVVGSPVGGSAVVGSPVGGSPEVEAPAIEAPVAEVPAVAERAPADATAVERLIVEAAPPVDEPVGGTPADGISNGSGRPARQRRSRVTRTAGSPAAPDGDAQPAAVVTVATQPVPAPAVEPVAVLITAPAEGPQQPVPSTASRPRRTRRSASRPAGPPVGDAGANAGGDPV